MNENIITSAQNPKIKKLLALQQKSSERSKNGLFIVEGRRELLHCVNAGYEIDTIFYCPSVMNEGEETDSVMPLIDSTHSYEVNEIIYNKIAYRGGTEGVIAEVKIQQRKLTDLNLPESPIIVVLESIEKPGNLGAILRTADAAGVDAVIVCDPRTDLYNPNLIRSSIGGIFSVKCVACSSEKCINYLKEHNIRILTAQLQDSNQYYDTDMTVGIAIVMGTEATGLTYIWRQAADAHIRIPMLGQLDSLNVSTSAAILMYEAVRQRHSG